MSPFSGAAHALWFFGVADSYGIELVHPWRERRTQRAVARKGLSNHRWIVGAKLALVLKMKKLTHRLWAPFQARLAYACAVFNICTAWDGEVKLQLAPFAL